MPLVFFLISLIPSVVFYFWMKKDPAETDEYRAQCRAALGHGLFCAVPVFIGSSLIALIGSLVFKINTADPVLKEFYKNFFTIAMVEEGVKCAALLYTLKKESRPSWLRIIVYMVIIGIGFEAIEGLVYMFISSPVQILVRGVTLMHGVFGFIMGYFIGKGRKTGKKIYYVLGYMIPYLMHASYDFTLQDTVIEWNDNLVFVCVNLAIISFGLFIYMYFFMKKARRNLAYTQSIIHTS
ncbi:MAG: PrsW family intramembrane metalloprotease [Erysipelotrichales bacterium]|nr:PrsW family intramembrane metalloprotease [Erysipelotrichales bacterium]